MTLRTHSSSPQGLLWTLALVILSVSAFQPCPTFHQRRAVQFYSSIGGGGDGNPPTPPGDDKWDGFFDPREESDDLKRAREYMDDKSLPISFEKQDEEEQEDEQAENSSSALMGPSSLIERAPSAADLSKNPYLKVVSNLSPSDLISKFTSTAPTRVQNAVRSTILGLIGGLPKLAFDTTTITTGQRLASLMFQLQMTGYMFKNAEYRLSLSQSLGMASSASFGQSSNLLLAGANDEDEEEEHDPLKTRVHGKLKIRYGNTTKDDEDASEESGNGGMEMEVDAAAYMSELRSEVAKLRDELQSTREEKDEALRKDLLTYIRTLPEQQLRSLTNTVSKDVLIAMKGLVNVVLSGIADEDGEIGPDTVTEQSGESMAQLLMWQLVVGYNLRELEVREEMKNSLAGRFDDLGTGVDFSDPGTLE